MYCPTFALGSFDALPHAERVELLREFVESLISVNRAYLRHFPLAPALYAAGVRFVREELCGDEWQDAARILETRAASSPDLVAYRVAELRERDGEPTAGPLITSMVAPSGVTLWHVSVVRESGAIEDPAVILGT